MSNKMSLVLFVETQLVMLALIEETYKN